MSAPDLGPDGIPVGLTPAERMDYANRALRAELAAGRAERGGPREPDSHERAGDPDRWSTSERNRIGIRFYLWRDDAPISRT